MSTLTYWSLLVLILVKATFAFPNPYCAPHALFPSTVHTLPLKAEKKGLILQASKNPDDYVDDQRRKMWTKTLVQAASGLVGASALLVLARPVWANSKSRSTGYAIQKSDTEWKRLLSPLQYKILREGGTERRGYSVLYKESRAGTFSCAACGTPLFASADKFDSGTGWPSFARGLPGVEIEAIHPAVANLSGAELRCAQCGGHLGDVFQDGWLFSGTEAAQTGQRFCIDGAALVFVPTDPQEDSVRGDLSAQSA
jgi:peptide-methionine (R)-S-oxide reductase